MRGPMPVRLGAEANRGMSGCGRMGLGCMSVAGSCGACALVHGSQRDHRCFSVVAWRDYIRLRGRRRWRRRPRPSSAWPGYQSRTVMTDDVESRRRRAALSRRPPRHQGNGLAARPLCRGARCRTCRLSALAVFERLLDCPTPSCRHDPASRDRARRRIRRPDRAAAQRFTGWQMMAQRANEQQDAPAGRRRARARSCPACRMGSVPLVLGSLVAAVRRSRRQARPPLLAARRPRRPAAGGACRGPGLLRAQGARHPVPGLGHGALRPHRPQQRDRGHAHRGAGAAGGHRAQGADRRPHHRQRHPAARAAARVHPPLAEDHRARPAHRHERADRSA